MSSGNVLLTSSLGRVSSSSLGSFSSSSSGRGYINPLFAGEHPAHQYAEDTLSQRVHALTLAGDCLLLPEAPTSQRRARINAVSDVIDAMEADNPCDSGFNSSTSSVLKDLENTRYRVVQNVTETIQSFNEDPTTAGTALHSMNEHFEELLSPLGRKTTSRTREAVLELPFSEEKTLDHLSIVTALDLRTASNSKKEKEAADLKAAQYHLFEAALRVKKAAQPLLFYKAEELPKLPPLTATYMQACLEDDISIGSEMINEGGNAVIYPMTMAGQKYAVKKYISTHRTSAEEVKFGQKMDHPNVMSALAATKDLIIYPLGKKDLASYIQELHSLDTITKEQSRAFKQYLYDVAMGLAALEKEHLLHRDVKPGNMLIIENKEGSKAVVIDPDLVVDLESYQDEDYPQYNGTFDYCSPEMAKTFFGKVDLEEVKSSDVFAYGYGLFLTLKRKKVESPYVSFFNKTGKQSALSMRKKASLEERASQKDLTERRLSSSLDPDLRNHLDETGVIEFVMNKCLGPASERPSFSVIASILKTDLELSSKSAAKR